MRSGFGASTPLSATSSEFFSNLLEVSMKSFTAGDAETFCGSRSSFFSAHSTTRRAVERKSRGFQLRRSTSCLGDILRCFEIGHSLAFVARRDYLFPGNALGSSILPILTIVVLVLTIQCSSKKRNASKFCCGIRKAAFIPGSAE